DRSWLRCPVVERIERRADGFSRRAERPAPRAVVLNRIMWFCPISCPFNPDRLTANRLLAPECWRRITGIGRSLDYRLDTVGDIRFAKFDHGARLPQIGADKRAARATGHLNARVRIDITLLNAKRRRAQRLDDTRHAARWLAQRQQRVARQQPRRQRDIDDPVIAGAQARVKRPTSVIPIACIHDPDDHAITVDAIVVTGDDPPAERVRAQQPDGLVRARLARSNAVPAWHRAGFVWRWQKGEPLRLLARAETSKANQEAEAGEQRPCKPAHKAKRSCIFGHMHFTVRKSSATLSLSTPRCSDRAEKRQKHHIAASDSASAPRPARAKNRRRMPDSANVP